VSEVDAAAKHAFAVVFSALHVIAAQHADLGLRIENREIDGDFSGIDRGVVFRIQMARIFLITWEALPLRIISAAPRSRWPVLSYSDSWARASGRAAASRGTDAFRTRVGEHARHEIPWSTFVTLLVALHERRFGVDLRLRRG